MATIHADKHTFQDTVTFAVPVTFAEDPPVISLDNIASLGISADMTVGDDLIVTDDASIGGDAAITGNATVGGTLGVTGATTAAALACTTLAASGAATLGSTLAVTGATTCAALTSSGQIQAADLVATDDLTVTDDATIGGDLAVTGALAAGSITTPGLTVGNSVDFSQATVNFGLGTLITLYECPELTIDGFTASATQSIELDFIPVNAVFLACWATTESGSDITSSNGSTTGLSLEIGTPADPDAIMTSVSIFGTKGVKRGNAGVWQGTRISETLEMKFTATGGAPNLTHIQGMGLVVHLLYISVD